MNQNFKKVDVLYAKAKIVDEDDDFNLQKIVNELSEHFYERGGFFSDSKWRLIVLFRTCEDVQR